METCLELLDAMQRNFDIWAPTHAGSGTTIARAEKELGRRLPSDYQLFLTRIGALSVVAKEEVWPVPRVGDVGPFWLHVRGLEVYGLGQDLPPEMQLEQRADSLPAECGIAIGRFKTDPALICLADEEIGRCIDSDCDREAATFSDFLVKGLRELHLNAEKVRDGEFPLQRFNVALGRLEDATE